MSKRLSHPLLDSDAAFNKLAKALQLPRCFTLGLVQMLVIRLVEKQTDLIGDKAEVERLVEWPGTPGFFFEHFAPLYLIENQGKWYLRDLRLWAAMKIDPQEPGFDDEDETTEFAELVMEFGLDVYTGPIQRGAIEWMLNQHGIELVREGMLAAQASIGGGPGIIAWCEKYIAGRKAQAAVRKQSQSEAMAKRMRARYDE